MPDLSYDDFERQLRSRLEHISDEIVQAKEHGRAAMGDPTDVVGRQLAAQQIKIKHAERSRVAAMLAGVQAQQSELMLSTITEKYVSLMKTSSKIGSTISEKQVEGVSAVCSIPPRAGLVPLPVPASVPGGKRVPVPARRVARGRKPPQRFRRGYVGEHDGQLCQLSHAGRRRRQPRPDVCGPVWDGHRPCARPCARVGVCRGPAWTAGFGRASNARCGCHCLPRGSDRATRGRFRFRGPSADAQLFRERGRRQRDRLDAGGTRRPLYWKLNAPNLMCALFTLSPAPLS